MKDDKQKLISEIQDSHEIYSALSSLGDCLYNQEVNTPVTLQMLSDKFAKYGTVLIVRVREDTVGFCSFYTNDKTSFIAFLSMIVVKKDYQGHGIGNDLLDATIKKCKENGMQYVRLEVDNTNLRAISFYMHRGFVFESKNEISSFYIYKLKE